MTSLPLPIDPAHPAFEGHFPSRPIVPGVVLLDHGLRAVDALRDARGDAAPPRACRIGTTKFLSFVRPGEPVRLELEHVAATSTARDDWRLRIYAGRPDDERLAMTGSVSFDAGDAAVDAAPGASA